MGDSTETIFAHLDNHCGVVKNTSCSVNLITLISNLSYSDLIVFVFVATLSVLTASGNMVVIVVFSVFKQFHTPANLVVLSLALSDFLIGAIVMPLEIVLLLDTCLHHMKSLCPVYHFISTIVGTVSLYHVVLIAVDRCFALHNPFCYIRKITVKTMLVCIISGWIFSLCYNVLMMQVGSSNRGEEKLICIRNCAIPINDTWGFVDLIFTFIVPCVLILSLYVRVFTVALRHAKTISHMFPAKISASQKKRKSEFKATKTLGTVVMVYLVCWIPWYTCLVNIESLPNPSVSISYLMCLYYSNSCVNPIIYAISYPWLKKSVNRTFSIKNN